MKKLFIACTLTLAVFFSASAQKKSGAIQFEMTADPALMAAGTGITLTDEMKARLPKSMKSPFELLYNATNASYMPVQDVEDSNGGGRGGGMAMMMMRFGGGGGGSREYFYSFADQKLSEVFDLNDTTYSMASKLTLKTAPSFNGNSAVQIQADPPVVEVVKSDETKEIVGFLCHKVTVKTTRKVKILDLDREVTDETVLWYTNDLGFNFSPIPTMWTEGAVLSIEGRGTSTTAKSIEFRSVSSKDVVAPKKVTPITEEEYQAKMAANRNRPRNGGGNRGGGQPAIRNIIIN